MRLTLLALLAATSLLTSASAQVQPAGGTLDQTLGQAQAEAASADAEVRRLERAAESARSEASASRARQLAAAQAIAAAEARISAADAEIRLASARQRHLRERLAKEQQPLSALLAGLSIMAERPPLLSLASAGSSEELVRIRVLVDATAPVIRHRTSELASQLSAGAKLQSSLRLARERLAAGRTELAAKQRHFRDLERRALAAASENQAGALVAGDTAIAAAETADVLGGDAGQARTAAAIASELAREPPPPSGPASGPPALRAPFPYVLPAEAPVRAGLGMVSASGVRSRGISLGTARGATVRAPASGTVRFSGPFRDFDGVVIIDHGGGWLSLVVNVASQLRRGQKVAIGAPLGRALGSIDVELSHKGRRLSPALIAGSSPPLSKGSQDG